MNNQNNGLFAKVQLFEVTEYAIYERLLLLKNKKNYEVFQSLADGSKKHAEYWRKITGQEIKPSLIKVFAYGLVFKLFGLTFGTRFMEASEKQAEKMIAKVITSYPEHRWILEEEKIHEQKLVALINEDMINYLSSIVLGANDAIVSTVGTAAGLSMALNNAHLIGMTSLISGATAALSMSASSYVSSLTEKSTRKPVVAAVYTGVTYIATVIVLAIPYFLLEQLFTALFLTVGISSVIIAALSYYLSVIQQISFWKRFLQNIALSIGIAIISFIIGFIVNKFFGLQV